MKVTGVVPCSKWSLFSLQKEWSTYKQGLSNHDMTLWAIHKILMDGEGDHFLAEAMVLNMLKQAASIWLAGRGHANSSPEVISLDVTLTLVSRPPQRLFGKKGSESRPYHLQIPVCRLYPKNPLDDLFPLVLRGLGWPGSPKYPLHIWWPWPVHGFPGQGKVCAWGFENEVHYGVIWAMKLDCLETGLSLLLWAAQADQ